MGPIATPHASITRAALPLCLALSACGTADPAGQPDALVEAIVYTTLRPPNTDILLFDEPGGTPRRLAADPALDYNAVFSPNGRWVVFTSERSGNPDLYALELDDGAEAIRLTWHDAMDDAASFSPDGQRLAFVSARDGDATGGQAFRLTSDKWEDGPSDWGHLRIAPDLESGRSDDRPDVSGDGEVIR